MQNVCFRSRNSCCYYRIFLCANNQELPFFSIKCLFSSFIKKKISIILWKLETIAPPKPKVLDQDRLLTLNLHPAALSSPLFTLLKQKCCILTLGCSISSCHPFSNAQIAFTVATTATLAEQLHQR